MNNFVEFEIVIFKRFNNSIINYAPEYQEDILNHHYVEVFEKDLILGNSSIYRWWSPSAIDIENNTVITRFDDAEKYPFMSTQIYEKNGSFSFAMDMSQMNYLDEGSH